VPATVADHVEPVRGDERRMWYGRPAKLMRSLSLVAESYGGRARQAAAANKGLMGWPLPESERI